MYDTTVREPGRAHRLSQLARIRRSVRGCAVRKIGRPGARARRRRFAEKGDGGLIGRRPAEGSSGTGTRRAGASRRRLDAGAALGLASSLLGPRSAWDSGPERASGARRDRRSGWERSRAVFFPFGRWCQSWRKNGSFDCAAAPRERRAETTPPRPLPHDARPTSGGRAK